jgi:hypothetical protein
MSKIPDTLEEAIAHAQEATKAAIAAGYTRLQVDLMLPELKPIPTALQFLPGFDEYESGLKVFFTDAGAAALARRDWGEVPYRLASIDVAGNRQTSTVEELAEPEDQAFLFVAPSSVEIGPVEQVCNAAGERPAVLFNPRLEDVGVVGIGYTARKIRDRFLNTFEPCYYLRPLDPVVLLRKYPSPWQVWLETEEGYRLIGEELQKPDSETLDKIVIGATGTQNAPKRSFLANLQQMLKALGQ